VIHQPAPLSLLPTNQPPNHPNPTTQVLVATGLVSEREVRKYEREAREMGKASFYLAWLMDEDRCVGVMWVGGWVGG
jgi:hypothetical protein